MKSKLKPLIDSQLSTLDWTQEDRDSLLRQLKGEPEVKKKLTLALAMALVLGLLAITALAVTLWKSYYGKMAKNEGEAGYFDTWSGQRRADFVLDMAGEGAVFDPAALDRLAGDEATDAEKSQLATRLLTDKYGFREDTITAISIMEAEKGPLPRWSLEDKAAYTQMLVDTGTLGQDEEMYLLPGDGDLPREEVAAAARQAILDTFPADEQELDRLEMHVELRSYAHAKENRVWRVFYLEPGQDAYSPSVFDVELDAATGEVQDIFAASHEKQAYFQPVSQEMIDLDQSFIRAFKEARPYTAEGLAGLLAAWKPRLAEIEANRKDWGGYYAGYRHVLHQDIRLPGEGAIALEDARKAADAAVLSLPQWTREKLDLFERFAEVFHHSGELKKPVYQFIYSWRSGANLTEEEFNPAAYASQLFSEFKSSSPPRYINVLVDALTGQVIGEPEVAELSGYYSPGEMELTLIR